jgi:uncharacterized membrane protein YidH (DUF202 family)
VTEELSAGLQSERTILAHWRTALATIVVGLLVVRQSTPGTERAVAIVVAAVAGAIACTAMIRRQRRLLAGPVTASPWTVAAVTLAVAALQLGALVVVL